MNSNQNYRDAINIQKASINTLRNDISTQNTTRPNGYKANIKNLRDNIKLVKVQITQLINLKKQYQQEIKQHARFLNEIYESFKRANTNSKKRGRPPKLTDEQTRQKIEQLKQQVEQFKIQLKRYDTKLATQQKQAAKTLKREEILKIKQENKKKYTYAIRILMFKVIGFEGEIFDTKENGDIVFVEDEVARYRAKKYSVISRIKQKLNKDNNTYEDKIIYYGQIYKPAWISIKNE